MRFQNYFPLFKDEVEIVAGNAIITIAAMVSNQATTGDLELANTSPEKRLAPR